MASISTILLTYAFFALWVTVLFTPSIITHYAAGSFAFEARISYGLAITSSAALLCVDSFSCVSLLSLVVGVVYYILNVLYAVLVVHRLLVPVAGYDWSVFVNRARGVARERRAVWFVTVSYHS